jgi:hypothetical protein
MVLKLGVTLPLRGPWLSQLGDELLASSRWSPRMLLNILQDSLDNKELFLPTCRR